MRPMRLRRNILVTGASSGLGQGMAREYAKLGRNLALCARRVDRLDELKRELVAANPGIQVFVRSLDVMQFEAIEREPSEAYVPRWPWQALGFLMKRLPLSALARMT